MGTFTESITREQMNLGLSMSKRRLREKMALYRKAKAISLKTVVAAMMRPLLMQRMKSRASVICKKDYLNNLQIKILRSCTQSVLLNNDALQLAKMRSCCLLLLNEVFQATDADMPAFVLAPYDFTWFSFEYHLVS